MKRYIGLSRLGQVAWSPLVWVIWGTHPGDRRLRWHHGRTGHGKRYELRWDWRGRFVAFVLGKKMPTRWPKETT